MTFKKIESIVDDVKGLQWSVDGVICRRVGLYDFSDIEKGQEGEYLIPSEGIPPGIAFAYKIIDGLEDGRTVKKISKKSLLRDLAFESFGDIFDVMEIERHYSEKN